MPAPIALFVYNRLNETRQTIESLKKNVLAEESDLFIYSDGPRQDGFEKVQEVRNYIKTIDGFKSIFISESESNKGLADSIISGVTEIVNRYGTIIVLEDDMITSPYFLQYMNDGLSIYEKEDKVISIHGYNFPVSFPESIQETFFIRGADCWGWATWKRGWDLFEKDAVGLIKRIEDSNLVKEFNFKDSYPYMEMLREAAIKNHSWAIRWYASAFIKNKLTLYPKVALVKNIGVVGTNSNGADQSLFGNYISNHRITYFEKSFTENKIAFSLMAEYLKKNYMPALTIWEKIKKVFK